MSDVQLDEIIRQLAALRAENKMILKMQKSILQSQKHYHVAGGFCWGNTADGAPFLVLYPKSDKLKEKICRVYADDYQFGDIPEWIRATQEDTGLDQTKDKEWAQKRGVYRQCPAMGVITMDGRDTQMGKEKRFAGVLWVSGQPQQAQPTPRSTPPATPAPSTNGNGHKAQPAPVATLPPLSVYEGRLDPLYGDDWPTALAVLCRATSLGKLNNPIQLSPAQLQQLENKIAIRETLHDVGRKKYGGQWPAVLLKAVRGRGEIYDIDAELADEQVGMMTAAIRTPEKMAA